MIGSFLKTRTLPLRRHVMSGKITGPINLIELLKNWVIFYALQEHLLDNEIVNLIVNL